MGLKRKILITTGSFILMALISVPMSSQGHAKLLCIDSAEIPDFQIQPNLGLQKCGGEGTWDPEIYFCDPSAAKDCFL